MRQTLVPLLALLLLAATPPVLAQGDLDAHGLNEAGKAAMAIGDMTTAVRIFQQLSDADDPNGMNNLGVFYDRGQGVPQDRKLAFSLYKRSADHPGMIKPQSS